MYVIVSEKFSSKNPKLYKECVSSLTFCHPVIWQFLNATSIDWKELKLEQTAQINQLFQLLNQICVYGHVMYGLPRMLMRKKENNDVSKDLPVCQR